MAPPGDVASVGGSVETSRKQIMPPPGVMGSKISIPLLTNINMNINDSVVEDNMSVSSFETDSSNISMDSIDDVVVIGSNVSSKIVDGNVSVSSTISSDVSPKQPSKKFKISRSL